MDVYTEVWNQVKMHEAITEASIMNFNRTPLTLDQILPVFDGITDAVFIDNADGVCQWCNNACEDMYEVEYDEIVGRTVDDLEKSESSPPL